jgi:hypothetical protein
MRRIACLAAALGLLAPATVLEAGREDSGSGVYGMAGLGFLSLQKGTGLGVPLGAMAVFGRQRLVASAGLLDLGLFEGRKSDPRFYRYYEPLNGFVCVDQQSGYMVPDYWCSGNPDVLRSFTMDVSYMPVDAVLIGSRPGKLFTGVGLRLLNPRTAYGTIGMLFGAAGGPAGLLRVSLGREYVFAGVSWGWSLGRLLGRR